MRRLVGAACGSFLVTAAVLAQSPPAGTATKKPAAAPATARKAPLATPLATTHADTAAAESHAALVKQYCATCHSEKGKSGGLSLANFDPAKSGDDAEVTEKMIRKLRAGMMPPPAAKERPDAATATAFAASLEARIDEVAATHV